MELLPCPFCGSEAEVNVTSDTYQIISCSTEYKMVCPAPSQVIYKRDGSWDYSSWNKRYIAG